MKLYEIDTAIQSVYDQIEQNDGVLPDELESQLNDLQMERIAKISNVIKLLRNIDSNIIALDVEIAMLQKKLKALENRKQSVKNFLAYAVGEGNKFKDTIATVYWLPTESVDISDVDSLPEMFVHTEKTPDKRLIKQYLDGGCHIEGCEIVKKQSLVVR